MPPAHSPWAWREDWLRGRVQSESKRSSATAAWIAVLAVNAFSLTTVLVAPWRDGPAGYGVFGFLALGVSLLGMMVLQALRTRRFGQTWFAMASVPAAPGGELRGTIHTRFSSPPERGVLVRLTCVQRMLATDPRDPVTEHVLWREEQTVGAGAIQSLPGASWIPVRFTVPADALESNRERSKAGVFWFLSAEASLAGVDYEDEFEIPVFRSADRSVADPAPALASLDAPVLSVGITAADLGRAGIMVGPVPGGTDFRFAAVRNLRAACLVTIVTVFWTGFFWLMLSAGPSLFVIVFGLFELLFILVLLDQWFASVRIIIAGGELRTRYSLLGFPVSTWRTPTVDIATFEMAVGMQVSGRRGTSYYDIRAVLRNGWERTLVQHIRDKRQAEWLVATMTAGLGRKSS